MSGGSDGKDVVQVSICVIDCYINGADRDRTGDLLLAKQALSRLSYGPKTAPEHRGRTRHRLP